jgi:quaternary ammonium compound-resistance protein SugE
LIERRDQVGDKTPRRIERRGWLLLCIAAGFEVLFALSTRRNQAYTVFLPSVLSVIGAVGGVYLLGLALKVVDVGAGYAAWTGISSVGIVTLAWMLFGESLTVTKCIFSTAIICGVLGLRYSPPT